MDNKRVDLSEQFSSIHDESFLNDLDQVAKRKSEEKAKSVQQTQHKKDNKLQTIIVACATVALIITAYFMVFNSNNNTEVADINVPARVAPRATQPSQQTKTVSSRRSRFNSAGNPNTRSASPNQRNRARSTGSQGYEQPNDSGM